HIYADFTGKAEESRKISAKDMDHLARGRVWPGDEAQRLGLVDALGGFSTALGLIRQLAHLPSQMPIALVTFPRPQSPTDYILSLAKGGHLPAALAEARNLSRTLTRVQVLFQPFSPLLGQSDAHLLGPSLTAP
ncbi:MAG TPA: signal peptide peptidase SppA, partial [Rhodospirillaceae bacterium]|nr:signal peptide peptidase SppA [Rhodospirillaceae bacterium]